MSLAKRLMEKESRRNLQRRCDQETTLRENMTRIIAALLIANDGTLTIKKSDLKLASRMRVQASVGEHGDQVLQLFDEDGSRVTAEVGELASA